MSTPHSRAAFEERRRQAQAALRAGRAATAEAWLRALEAQAPGEINCLWLLGVALLDQDKIEARVDLARAYRRAGQAAQAREEVRRVLEKSPHHQRAWLAYGDALVDLEQY